MSNLPGSNSTAGISYSPIFSSFEIEICAIRDGLLHLKENFNITGKNIVLCTDSQSSVKHLISLSLKPRVVSSLVYELITVVDDLIKNYAINLNFCWIPGHGNIGLNDDVDKIAKAQLENSEEEDHIELSIPRTRIERFNRSIEKAEFREYLMRNVKDSHWDDYPPRRYFQKTHDINSSNGRPLDIGVFRLQTGHNRLRKHLYNIGIEETDRCRFCETCAEDGYHLLTDCPGLLNTSQARDILDLRTKSFIFGRNEYHGWLFSNKETVRRQQQKFLKILQALNVTF